MISALAITRNEEEHIERYIKELSFANEIIIIDSYSNDKTVEIAESLGATVIKREFKNFSEQKNAAISKAKYDWCLFFDLDEQLPKPLIEEIKTIIASKPKCIAYKIKRQFHFMGKKIKYSGFQTDESVRLFNKQFCQYNEKLVHETMSCNGKIGKLKHHLNHKTYKSFDNYNQKLNHYSKLQAQDLYQKNVRPNGYHFLFRPWYRFMHQYFFRFGILDGKEGFIISYVHAFSVFKRYVQLWNMHRKIE